MSKLLLLGTRQPRVFSRLNNLASKLSGKHGVSSTLWDPKIKLDLHSSSNNKNLRSKYDAQILRSSLKDSSSSFFTGPDTDHAMLVDENHVSWVYSHLPKNAQPYARLARLDRPIVTWLYILPCFWAIAMAASPGKLPNMALLALFGIACLLIRGYGCTINDILDSEVDKKVCRTKQRPIASGEVTPLQAMIFLFLQLIVCLSMLFPALNNYSKVLGIPFFPLVSLYPLMKRFTYWPQAYLGVSFNWLALVAWSAVKGSLDLPIAIPLYISLIFWTISYDTIYAHQDREEDIKVGLKSTAVLFGDSTKIWCLLFNIACIGCLALSGFNAKIGGPFYVSLALAFAHLTWQTVAVDLSNSTDCKNKFISNIWAGAIVFIGICLGKLVN